MHALTCDLLNIGDTGYAMIPTYYVPNRFIKCKVFVEYVWNYERSIFYHVTIAELLDDEFTVIKKLSTAYVRCINRFTRKLDILPIPIHTTLSKQSLLTQIRNWHKDHVIDLPAPFGAKSIEGLANIELGIRSYFKELYQDILSK